MWREGLLLRGFGAFAYGIKRKCVGGWECLAFSKSKGKGEESNGDKKGTRYGNQR
jgi:hypothetical protein